LRFARWLVDNGRLSEHAGYPLEGPSEARDTEATAEIAELAERPGGEPVPHDKHLPASDCPVDPALERAQRDRPAEWRLILLRAWSRLRRGMAKIGDSRRELGQWYYLPGEGGPGDACGTYDPYGPRGPYTRGLFSSPGPLPNDPWLWMRYRHDG
jgi:hypothetical protein